MTYGFSRLGLLIAALWVWQGAATAATPEQAERAKACELPAGTIESSLEKAPLIADLLETLPHGGQGNGPVQVIEFFDYNCPTCRAMSSQWAKIIDGTDNVRVDYVEIGVFGRGSREAARTGLAILEQSETAYMAYHQGLMLNPGKVNGKKVDRVMGTLDLDIDAIKARANSDEIKAQRKTNENYFVSLGMNATPGLIVDGIIIPADSNIGANVSCVMKYARRATNPEPEAAPN